MTLTPRCPECEWLLRPWWIGSNYFMGCDECGFMRFPSADEAIELINMRTI
jgi:hypothetical protein